MTILNKRESRILFGGDVIILAFSLWFTLLIRYGHLPSKNMINEHILAFLPVIVIWLAVYFIAGLYERHTMFLRRRLAGLVFRAQIVNAIAAIGFFYFATYLKVAPKTILFLYFVLSSIALVIWRNYGYKIMGNRQKQNAFLIGNVEELRELETEVNHNDLYPIRFISSIDFDDIASLDIKKDLTDRVYSENVSVIAVDMANEKIVPLLPHLYNLVFSNVRFISLHKLYGDIFKRVPLSLVRYNWFLENISSGSKPAFDFVKRFLDIVVSLVLGVLSLLFYPFVYLAIKLDDGGVLFSIQERIGRGNKIIKIYKFRTMLIANDGGKWGDDNKNKITRVGYFLRRSRIDELPQLWNVLKGDLSLIGPRPEFPDAVSIYKEQISYYAIRHLITPGLSGWAQIYGEHPHHEVGFKETMEKLSYDLYYMNNRSFLLDLEIALKTIRILLTFKGK